jgi:hypothetical protein
VVAPFRWGSGLAFSTQLKLTGAISEGGLFRIIERSQKSKKHQMKITLAFLQNPSNF